MAMLASTCMVKMGKITAAGRRTGWISLCHKTSIYTVLRNSLKNQLHKMDCQADQEKGPASLDWESLHIVTLSANLT
jgi:hypothetical protein